jgi:hypothetical protein
MRLIINNNSDVPTEDVMPVITRIMKRGRVSEIKGKPCYCLTTRAYRPNVYVHFDVNKRSDRAVIENGPPEQ